MMQFLQGKGISTVHCEKVSAFFYRELVQGDKLFGTSQNQLSASLLYPKDRSNQMKRFLCEKVYRISLLDETTSDTRSKNEWKTDRFRRRCRVIILALFESLFHSSLFVFGNPDKRTYLEREFRHSSSFSHVPKIHSSLLETSQAVCSAFEQHYCPSCWTLWNVDPLLNLEIVASFLTVI